MKKIKAFALFAIAGFAMAGYSFAQDHAVQATVPFDFTVGQTLLPAGTYTIQAKTDHLVSIRNQGKPISAFALVNTAGRQSRDGGKLMFHKYGDQYFLSEILCQSADLDARIPPSKLEKRTLEQAKGTTSSQTFVATR